MHDSHMNRSLSWSRNRKLARRPLIYVGDTGSAKQRSTNTNLNLIDTDITGLLPCCEMQAGPAVMAVLSGLVCERGLKFHRNKQLDGASRFWHHYFLLGHATHIIYNNVIFYLKFSAIKLVGDNLNKNLQFRI